MKADWSHLEAYRFTNLGHPLYSEKGEHCGAFIIQQGQMEFIVIADDGRNLDNPTGWEHVSMRTKYGVRERCPTWSEMCFAKNLFWEPGEAVFQMHPPLSEYINLHPFCLHLFRPTDGIFPRPPSILIGPNLERGARDGNAG